MLYKVGDEVVLKNGKKVEVEIVEEDSFYVVGKKGDFFLTKVLEDNIDHDKTATLNRENYAKYMEEQINDPAYQELLKELSEPVVDTVNHPPHYTQGDIETIDIIKVLTQGYTGYEGSLVGNVIKYLARANFKGNKAEDLKKGRFYYDELIKELEQ